MIKMTIFISGHPRAQKYALIQAKVLAMTAIDVMIDPELLVAAKEKFKLDISTGA